MLKRLIGVITVKDNWAIQSIGYKRYLPMGRPEVIAENYDRWQLDEIFVVDIDRSRFNQGPNFELLERITEKKLMTPLCYMGGIRNSDDALKLISLGADRIALDNLYKVSPSAVKSISDTIGRQAVIRAQPLITRGKDIFLYDHISGNAEEKINIQNLANSNSYFSELMIVDVLNEGSIDAFNTDLLIPFRESNLQLICFGGITTTEQIKHIFAEVNVSAIAIGNSLNYREIPHKSLLPQTEVDLARQTSFGLTTRGAKEW